MPGLNNSKHNAKAKVLSIKLDAQFFNYLNFKLYFVEFFINFFVTQQRFPDAIAMFIPIINIKARFNAVTNQKYYTFDGFILTLMLN